MAFNVTLRPSGHSFATDSETTLLQAALDAGFTLPYGCRNGACGSCKGKVLEGEVEMHTNHALEDYEVQQGYVLTCQCYPLTDKLVVSYYQ